MAAMSDFYRELHLGKHDTSSPYGPLVRRENGSLDLESLFRLMDLLAAYTIKEYTGGSNHIITAHAEIDFLQPYTKNRELRIKAMPHTTGTSSVDMGLCVEQRTFFGWEPLAKSYLTFVSKEKRLEPLETTHSLEDAVVQAANNRKQQRRQEQSVRASFGAESLPLFSTSDEHTVPSSAKNPHGIAGGGYLIETAYKQAQAAATQYTNSLVDLVAIRGASFLTPVSINSVLRVEAGVHYAEKDAIIVKADTSFESTASSSSYFVFRPQNVPTTSGQTTLGSQVYKQWHSSQKTIMPHNQGGVESRKSLIATAVSYISGAIYDLFALQAPVSHAR